MSTKIAKSDRTITDQARSTIYDSVKAASSWLAPIESYAFNASTWAMTCAAPPAIHQVSEKAVEAYRQIGRVKSLSALCEDGAPGNKEQIESIASSVALIGSLISSPLPIPVASSGAGHGTTLFFEDEGFYGDLEIRGRLIEYYIRSNASEGMIEVYDSEEIEDGFIPPRLLSCLFEHYAR